MLPLEISSKKVMPLEFNRILNRDLFIYILDLEVKRARRYQNFICLLFIKLKKFSDEANNNGWVFQTCYETLSDLLMVEMRESDILGSLGEGQLVALLPYADKSAGIFAKSRFEGVLKYFDFKNKGYEVEIDPICFPMHGADTVDLLKKALEAKPS
jgi:GGDEF domain-containing protein